MTLDRQLSLLPECGDKPWSALHGLEPIAREGTDLIDGVQAQVSQFALLHVSPNVFDRIHFGRIGGQALDHDGPVKRLDVMVDNTTAVSRQAIPDHEQL